MEEWIDRTRTHLRGCVIEAAWRRADQESALGNLAAAAQAASRANELTPDDELGLRRLIELLDAAGRRADAFAAYDRFVRRQAKEFDEQPDAETTALVDRIRAAPVRERALQRIVTDAEATGIRTTEGEAFPRAADEVPSPRRRVAPRQVLAITGVLAALVLVVVLLTRRDKSLLAAGSVSPRDRILSSISAIALAIRRSAQRSLKRCGSTWPSRRSLG